MTLMCLCISGFRFCNSETKIENQKFYISPEALHIDETGLYVNFEECLYKISAVFSDEKGLFISNEALGTWECENGHLNPAWLFICQTCGALR